MNVTPSLRATRAAARVLFAAALLAPALAAQQPAPQPLSLADAVRLAARQSALVQSAALRTAQANARVSQSRSAFLPNLDAGATEAENTLNSATFGFNFPTQPGQPPFLNPLGQIIGPVTTLDLRARASQTLFDPAALGRLNASKAGAAAVGVGESAAAEQAAVQAAAAYVQVLRADAQLSARLADSSLAVDLLGIAQDQLTAGVGVALDVTRAESQLAGVKAQLISARNDAGPRPARPGARAQPAARHAVPAHRFARRARRRGRRRGRRRRRGGRSDAHGAPDLRGPEAQISAAQAQIDAVQDERLPAVNAFGNGGYIGLRINHLLATYTGASSCRCRCSTATGATRGSTSRTPRRRTSRCACATSAAGGRRSARRPARPLARRASRWTPRGAPAARRTGTLAGARPVPRRRGRQRRRDHRLARRSTRRARRSSTPRRRSSPPASRSRAPKGARPRSNNPRPDRIHDPDHSIVRTMATPTNSADPDASPPPTAPGAASCFPCSSCSSSSGSAGR